MIYGCYSIRDKMQGYGVVNCQLNDDVAKRNFEMLIFDESPTLLSRHPEDFELYYVGDFNTDTGEIEKHFPTKLIAKGESYVPKQVS